MQISPEERLDLIFTERETKHWNLYFWDYAVQIWSGGIQRSYRHSGH